MTSSAHYILAGFGDAWTAFKDGVVNVLPDSVLDVSGLETQAQKIDAAILMARKTFDEKLAYVRGLRKLSPQAARGARDYLKKPAASEIVSRGHGLVMADRAFHELTDGGLFRILGAFDVDRTDHLETELLAAVHHGRLSVRDMRRSLNAEMGRVPETGALSLKALIDPMRVVRIIKTDERGDFADKHLFIERKRDEVDRVMAQLLPRWRKIRYDFAQVAAFLPVNFQLHTDLLWNNEDYCQFMVRVLIFEHEEALDTLATRAEDAEDPQMLRALETVRASSQAELQTALRPYLTRAFQLQAQTKIVCRDFLGAVAAMEQAYKTDPGLDKRVPRAQVLDALLWEEVRGQAMDVFHQLGNQGFSAALSAKVMQYIGPAVPSKPMSFTQFLYGQVNPFAEVLTADGAWNVVENLGEQLAQEVVGRTLAKHTGVDKAYAEWAAGILVGAANKWTQKLGADGYARLRRSRLFQTAEGLQEAAAVVAQKRPDTEPDLEGSRKKSDLEERMADLTVVAAAEKQRQKAEADYRNKAREHGAESKPADAARERLLDAEADVRGRARPLTERRVESALAKYDAQVRKGGWNPKHALRLFRRLPLAKLRALKRAGKLPPELEQRVDAARLQMMDALQRDMVQWSNGDVVCVVITGAAANPDGPEYAMKLIDSDVDFTFLTRPGVSDKRLAEIEARYVKAVADACGRSPMELADSSGFCDKLHSGYDLKTLADITEANVTNPERYLNLGSTQFVLFMNKVAGRFKAFNKQTGQWETLALDANARIFGHQRFENWMGADIALEQFRFREAHREHRGADVAGFLKDQGKYTVRVALGKLISDPDGCARVNAMTPQEAIEAGGLHAAIIKVAREFQGKLFTRRQIAFLEQCNALKKGARAEEVFGASGAGVNDAIRRHNQEADAFFDDALPVALRSQQQAMVAMESEGASAEDRRQAAKILLAQAWALSRLEPRHREHIARLSGDGKAMTSSLAALELAKSYRELVPPASDGDRHQPAPSSPDPVSR